MNSDSCCFSVGLALEPLLLGLQPARGQARLFGQLLQRLLDLQRLLAGAGLGIEPGALDRLLLRSAQRRQRALLLGAGRLQLQPLVGLAPGQRGLLLKLNLLPGWPPAPW